MKTLLLSLNFHPSGGDMLAGLIVSVGLGVFIYCWSHFKVIRK